MAGPTRLHRNIFLSYMARGLKLRMRTLTPTEYESKPFGLVLSLLEHFMGRRAVGILTFKEKYNSVAIRLSLEE